MSAFKPTHQSIQCIAGSRTDPCFTYLVNSRHPASQFFLLFLSWFVPRDALPADPFSSTFRTAPGEQVMSATDQYLFRAGLSRHVPKVHGLAAAFGGRMEGIPVRDAFGKSSE